jgi:hypothetical protein
MIGLVSNDLEGTWKEVVLAWCIVEPPYIVFQFKVVTFQTCYGSSRTLLSSGHFLRVTDLLVSYDMFLLSEQRTTALSYMRFEWPQKWHTVTTGGKSLSFMETWICLLTCVAVTVCLRKGIAEPSVLEDNCFHVWGPSSISWNSFVLKSSYVIGLSWLHNDSG